MRAAGRAGRPQPRWLAGPWAGLRGHGPGRDEFLPGVPAQQRLMLLPRGSHRPQRTGEEREWAREAAAQIGRLHGSCWSGDRGWQREPGPRRVGGKPLGRLRGGRHQNLPVCDTASQGGCAHRVGSKPRPPQSAGKDQQRRLRGSRKGPAE